MTSNVSCCAFHQLVSDLPPFFIGLDFETASTGEDLTTVFPIQIGLASPDPAVEVLSSDIGHRRLVVDFDSLGVNGFTMSRIDRAPSLQQVDVLASTWMDEVALTASAHTLTAVGWTVATFDLPLLRHWLPEAARYVGARHRVLDLQALALAADPWSPGRTRQKVRDLADAMTARMFDIHQPNRLTPSRHDAAFDASAALAELQLFRKVLAGEEI